MNKSRTVYTQILIFVVLLAPLILALSPRISFAGEADSWRKVREGIAGYTAVTGQEAGVLIQGSGQNWRQLRNRLVANYGAWLLAGTTLALGIFYIWRGQVKLSRNRSGITLPRWTFGERFLHWAMAIIFLILVISGFGLLYGRTVLIPIIGKQTFSAAIIIAKQLHNYSGPLFIIGLVLMFIKWAKDNLPNALDIAWFKAFGGLVGDQHPSAERMNGGEKAWFWLLIGAGAIVSITGLILDFTVFGQTRELLQINHIIHSISGMLLTVGALGHIYIGTIGTEGALEGMTHGKVDVTWAKQHHDRWYEQIKDQDQKNNCL
jgi:formate dehydrogenase subunit gamma